MNFKKYIKDPPYAPSKAALEAAAKAHEVLNQETEYTEIMQQQQAQYQKLRRRFMRFAITCVCLIAIGLSLLFPQVQTFANRLWLSLTQQSVQEFVLDKAQYHLEMPGLVLLEEYTDVDHVISIYQSADGYQLVYIEDYSLDEQTSTLTTNPDAISIDGIYSGISMKGYIEPDSVYVQFASERQGVAYQGSLSIDHSLSQQEVEGILNSFTS